MSRKTTLMTMLLAALLLGLPAWAGDDEPRCEGPECPSVREYLRYAGEDCEVRDCRRVAQAAHRCRRGAAKARAKLHLVLCDDRGCRHEVRDEVREIIDKLRSIRGYEREFCERACGEHDD
jgi:hypothetical protein